LVRAFFMFILLIMIKYLLVTAIDDPYISFVKGLYESAFPEKERRDWEKLLDMIENTPDMSLQLIEADTQVIGFLVLWSLEDWSFLEYFAIDPEHRGKNYGAQVMQHLMDLNHTKLILEVEPPKTDDAARRIHFYERSGLHCLPFNYLQPFYSNPEQSYPMLLMSNAVKKEEAYFTEVISLIKRHVYFKGIK